MLRIKYGDLNTSAGGLYYWEGKPFTGMAFELHFNGSVWTEVEMVDGTENGAVYEWYPSGKPKMEGYNRLDEQFGWIREWFENGQLKSEIEFDYGIRSKEKRWNEQGQLVFESERK